MSNTTAADKEGAIAQLRALAGPSLDADGARAVLEAVDYNVQAAAEMILDDPASASASAPSSSSSRNVHTLSSAPSSTSHTPLNTSSRTSQRTMGAASPSVPSISTARIEPLDIDDSLVGPPSRSNAGGVGLASALNTIIRLPLGLLAALIRLVLQLLRVPIPSILRAGPMGAPNFYRRPQPGGRHDAVADAERWLRELEEEAGAVQFSPTGTASGISGPSSEGLTHRAGGSDIPRHIPSFQSSSYDTFVQSLQSTLSIGIVVLLSSEHSTHAEFVRTTLTDPTLLSAINDNRIKAWGGDVRYRDAWSASQKLGATTYPFVAFIALQPRPSSSGSSSGTPRLTVLSRHQGIQNASASTLSAHITDTLVPRVQSFLTRLGKEKEDREREREYRAQQERAYLDAAAKDAARIEARLTLEREAAASAASLAQASKDAERAAEVLAAKNTRRGEWRRYIRASGMIPQEAKVGSGRGATRVVLRMPDGRRVVRVFPPGAEVVALWAFAAASLVPSRDVSPSSSSLALHRGADVPSAPNGITGEEGILKAIESEAGGNAEEWWGFRLASAFPRRVVGWERGKRIDAVEGFKGGAQLVVEMLEEGTRSPKSPKSGGEEGSGSDGYETESD